MQATNNKISKSNKSVDKKSGLFEAFSFTHSNFSYIAGQKRIISNNYKEVNMHPEYTGQGTPPSLVHDDKEIMLAAEQYIISYMLESKPFTEFTTYVGHGRNINKMMWIASCNTRGEVVNDHL